MPFPLATAVLLMYLKRCCKDLLPASEGVLRTCGEVFLGLLPVHMRSLQIASGGGRDIFNAGASAASSSRDTTKPEFGTKRFRFALASCAIHGQRHMWNWRSQLERRKATLGVPAVSPMLLIAETFLESLATHRLVVLLNGCHNGNPARSRPGHVLHDFPCWQPDPAACAAIMHQEVHRSYFSLLTALRPVFGAHHTSKLARSTTGLRSSRA